MIKCTTSSIFGPQFSFSSQIFQFFCFLMSDDVTFWYAKRKPQPYKDARFCFCLTLKSKTQTNIKPDIVFFCIMLTQHYDKAAAHVFSCEFWAVRSLFLQSICSVSDLSKQFITICLEINPKSVIGYCVYQQPFFLEMLRYA